MAVMVTKSACRGPSLLPQLNGKKGEETYEKSIRVLYYNRGREREIERERDPKIQARSQGWR